MKLYINNKNFEFRNEKIDLEKIIETINIEIKDSEKLLDSMNIDGVVIYSDYEAYILENIGKIKEIHVTVVSKKELLENTLVSGLGYIENAVPIVEKLADEFYTFPKEETWNNLIDLIDGISWIFNSFIIIDKDLNKYIDKKENWNLYAKLVYELNDILEELKDGMENQDNVLIGDILSYEIAPKFEEMGEKLLDVIKVDE